MGATEEASKAVGGFMDAMKSQPLSLALVIMNIGLMLLMYLLWTSAEEYRNKQMDLIFGSQKETQELLARCIIPEKSAIRIE